MIGVPLPSHRPGLRRNAGVVASIDFPREVLDVSPRGDLAALDQFVGAVEIE